MRNEGNNSRSQEDDIGSEGAEGAIARNDAGDEGECVAPYQTPTAFVGLIGDRYTAAVFDLLLTCLQGRAGQTSGAYDKIIIYLVGSDRMIEQLVKEGKIDPERTVAVFDGAPRKGRRYTFGDRGGSDDGRVREVPEWAACMRWYVAIASSSADAVIHEDCARTVAYQIHAAFVRNFLENISKRDENGRFTHYPWGRKPKGRDSGSRATSVKPNLTLLKKHGEGEPRRRIPDLGGSTRTPGRSEVAPETGPC